MEVHILCSAGKGIGIGHLSRMKVVYHEIRRKFKCEVFLHILDDSQNTTTYDNIILSYIPLRQSLDFYLNNLIKKNSQQIFIFDLKETLINSNFLHELGNIKKNNGILISIDNLFELSDDIDYFFMPTFRKQLGYEKIINDKISWGWDNFLLNTKLKPIKYNRNEKNLLVLTGGSDITNLGKHFPSLIDKKIQKIFSINWVVGPYSNQPSLDNVTNNNWNLLQSPSTLDSIMINSSYAITVFGVSFFELLYYGIPTVVFSPYGDKDKLDLEEISKSGIALVANDEIDALNKINILINDNSLSKKISIKASKIFNKRGEVNLCEIITKIIYTKWQTVI